jgi:hypothetical protein
VVGKPLDPASHTKPEVRDVLLKWVKAGFALDESGHWGTLRCTCENKCTSIPVSGTPQNPGSHARKIDRLAARCPLSPDSPSRSLSGRPR